MRKILRKLRSAVPVPLTVAVFVTLAAAPALAQAGVPTLSGVIDQLRNILVGILAALATLFLTIGGVRYMTANGDPSQVERAKIALRSAAIGYGLAALAPLFVSLLRSIVAAQ